MKALVISLIAAFALVFSGCSAIAPEGYQAVKAAKEKYESLDSARVVMEDISEGATLMEFSFYVNGKDEMVFSYSGGGEYAYSDGAEFFYKTAGAEEWEIIGPGDEGYIYNIYNREYRYPYARGSIFFLDGTSVESASVIGSADGPMSVTYVYDADKLNKNSVSGLENVSSFSSLTVTYTIDGDGCITEFTETGRVTDSDGVESDFNIRISVYDMNGITEIPRPDISE